MIKNVFLSSHHHLFLEGLSCHFKYWKASELRSWLFYYFLPILNTLPIASYFIHYAAFVEATSLLCGNSISEDSIQKSQVLLQYFVMVFSRTLQWKVYDTKHACFVTSTAMRPWLRATLGNFLLLIWECQWWTYKTVSWHSKCRVSDCCICEHHTEFTSFLDLQRECIDLVFWITENL